MAVYKSDKVTIEAPAATVYDKLSNLENLKGMLSKVPAERIPEDKRQMFENIRITPDTIEVPGPMGNMVFRVVEREAPHLIRLQGEGLPIQLGLALHVSPQTAESSQAQVEIDLDLPMMLKPMIGGQIQKIADQFGDVLAAIPFS